MIRAFFLLCLCGIAQFSFSQKIDTSFRILVVTAHPDDETGMAATIYKITHEWNGTVDQCVITNGEGGYKYSLLGESIYGLKLTDEKVGRENLPRIRKQELMNAGKIIGVNNLYFLDQKDAYYTLDEHEPLDTSWDVSWVQSRLKELMTKNHYDFIFCLLPDSTTHGGHKAASLLALRTVLSLPTEQRPIILGVSGSAKSDTARQHFTQLKNYSETKMLTDTAMFHVDKTASFGYKNKLNYKIVVNWEIAEHKSQGTMQLFMNAGDYEDYWYFALNGKDGLTKCNTMFDALKEVKLN